MKYCISGILITLFIASFNICAAQTYSITGKVTDKNGQAVKSANIFVSKIGETANSDSNQVISYSQETSDKTGAGGRYKVNNLTSGEYTVTAYYPGKKIVSKKVVIKDGDETVNFRLSILEISLNEIIVDEENMQSFGISRMRAVEGVTINEAKKNEVIMVGDLSANLATNNNRQVYAKVSGLNIWQSDDAGVQTSIGGRGLSPKRNSHFNTRQNGYDMAADALGDSESYYTPPIRALDQIEIIRGAASLQYGTQFGGMLNFVFKDGPENDPFQISTNQTYGSYGLFNSFNSVGGSTKNTNYYGFYQYKTSNGWRPNSGLDQHTAYGSANIDLTDKLTVSTNYTYMYYLAQQPGGLTDAEFRRNPRQSNRERNWFRVNWNLFALKGDYKISGMTRLNTRFFGLKAGRDAVGNLSRIDRLDFGGERDLLKDDYLNWGNETRLIHRYPFLDNISVFLAGIRYYSGFTHRRQGDGTDGSGPNFAYPNPEHLKGSDFDLPSRNTAVFVENIFNISPAFSITPGVRFEYINTEADGYYRNIVKDLAGNIILDETIQEERDKQRSFVLFGVGLSYKTSPGFELYGNFSQNYRAINFNDIRVDIGSLEVDPNLQDERGFNADIGIRGNKNGLFNYDVSLFHLSYQDRIGTVLKTEPNPKFNNLVDRTFRYRTNVADAKIFGIETFAELDLYKYLVNRNSSTRLSLFSNLSFITAEYYNSEISGIEGNEVENVPAVNFKTGLTFARDNFKASYQFTYVGEHFSDATNARHTPTAIEGIIPAYHVMDLSAEYKFNRYRLEAGVNNLTDHHYFTRRATGYPGPGIIPAKVRSFYITLGVEI
jgi:Fe(3+) dicitrate transport protein